MQAIALSQFGILAFGTFLMHIQVRAAGKDVSEFEFFLARNGIWFLAIPILWFLFAVQAERMGKGVAQFARALGVAMIIVFIACYLFGVYGGGMLKGEN